MPGQLRTGPRKAPGCRHIDYDEVMRSKIIVGTPAMVVDRLGQIKEELGLERDPGGVELRHALDSAPARHEFAASALRKGEAAIPVIAGRPERAGRDTASETGGTSNGKPGRRVA